MFTRVSRTLCCGIVVSLLALPGFLVVGCGPGGGGQEEKVKEGAKEAVEEPQEEAKEAVEEPIDTIEVNETEFSLEPADITLPRPGTYVFRAVNSGGVVHALEIEGEGIEEETPNIQPGESGELEANLGPGTYELYCPVGNHEELGMVGTITVEGG